MTSDSPVQRTARQQRAARLRTGSAILAVLAVAAYIYLDWLSYLAEPPPWSEWGVYGAILTAAWLAAIMGTLTWRQFAPDDPPRRMWGFFVAGFW